MNDNEHPIFIPNGYQINTKPTEHLANFILSNIRQGHHGCSVYGGGGLGKTTAQQFLTENAGRWLINNKTKQQIGVAARMVMPSGIRRSDRAFWIAMNQRLKLVNSIRMESSLGLERLVNFIRTRCGQARQRRMVLFIDNAQRITEAEYQYLEDLDGLVLDENLSLFLVLVRQSDSEGIDVVDDWLERPSHTVRRWFMDTAPFRPLTGIGEITHALSRYDRSVTWPTPDMPFSRYFAKDAFDRGWCLSNEAPVIFDGIRSLRKEYKLPETDAWPMATFTLVVHSLLADIARDNSDFKGFTQDQIRHVLLTSGYLRLEFVRARMRMPDIHGEEVA
ncbi:ATP-binding protein [Luteimonas sp. JM171]|uniref:Type II secretory pathway, component ExeA n=1 Tax=Luteimonas sp. JM171 TaxID=1896164 RepID=UPI000A9B3D59|nr:Type II secretory pathway, component ExeA [Luteimonas sp. JM171]